MKKRFYCDKCKRHLAWPLHICPWRPKTLLDHRLDVLTTRLNYISTKLDRAEKLLEKKFEETWEVLSHMSYKLDKLDRIEEQIDGCLTMCNTHSLRLKRIEKLLEKATKKPADHSWADKYYEKEETKK